MGKGGPQAKRLGKASRSPIPSSADGSARCCAEPSTPPPALVSRVGSLTVNHAARDVRLGDRQVELAPKEFELLRTLIADPTRVLTKVNFEARPAEGKGARDSGARGGIGDPLSPGEALAA